MEEVHQHFLDDPGWDVAEDLEESSYRFLILVPIAILVIAGWFWLVRLPEPPKIVFQAPQTIVVFISKSACANVMRAFEHDDLPFSAGWKYSNLLVNSDNHTVTGECK